jgi:heme exporter protein CcmD
MDFAAKNLGFVFGSYGLSIVVLAALAIWIIARDRRNRRALDDAAKRKRP